jgi:predicted extracellular nuclease
MLCALFSPILTAQASDLIISGVIDGPLPGGLPKAVEFYVVNDITDLSIYGVGSANNGGGTEGEEFTFSADSATAGNFLYVATEATDFITFFGFAPDYTGSAASINGDDAIELFENGVVVDVFGDINVDGSGQPWEYLDGWAYRVDGSAPGGDVFALSNWTFSGPNALEGETSNDAAASPFPLGTYSPERMTSSCGDPATLIHEIQGSGLSSPMVGNAVSIEGVVVGDFQDNGNPDNGDLGGFFVQEEDADADASAETSEGIFVYAPSSNDVQVGDKVRVSGTVQEYYGNTQIGSVTEMMICDPAEMPIVTDVSLPMTSIDDFEAYEGMFVRFPQELVISEYYNFDRYGEIVLAVPPLGQTRPYQPTAVEEPGSQEAADLTLLNSLSRIALDDGRTSQNPDPAIHPNGEQFDLDNRFRGGDIVRNATGVLNHAHNLYSLQPTVGADYEVVNPRDSEPEDVGGRLKVASFNVLNYFLTLDEDAEICGPAQNMGCRGADTQEEFVRQRTKILSALGTIQADVFGLIEMENTAEVEPLSDMVAGLNDILGAGTYAYVDTGTIGSDAIKVGLIYKPSMVTPVGDFAILDSSVDLRFVDTKNRPVLAQTFEENVSGALFTVAVNHLKSKGSSCGADDDDPEQGNCNFTRTQAAQALVDWLATDPTGSGDADYIIIGDLNAYDKEDPIAAITAGADDTPGTVDDFIDLIYEYAGELAYSYVYSGQFGYLDYALTSAGMSPQVTGVTEWHINADEPDILDYDMSFKQPAQDALYEANAFRSSDHDPVIVGLDLESISAHQICAYLGDDPNSRRLDYDFFSFSGKAGETITVTLEAVLPEAGGGERAGLVLFDEISGIFFLKRDAGLLPNQITVELPADGEYVVGVYNRPSLSKKRFYSGDYCLSLEAPFETSQTLEPAWSVE